jgi:hypothetical protein
VNSSARILGRAAMQHLVLSGAVPLALAACSGGGGGSGMSTAVTPTNPPPMTLTADFDSIQANIFTPICAGCHGGPNPASNLSLDAAHSYNDLVNVPSTEEPTLDRVKPGDPADSYLAIHLQKDGDGAPASDIPFVIQWITDGALPGSSAMPMATAFQIAATAPNPGDTLSAPPRIVVGFTQELDRSSANAASVRLERVDEDEASAAATQILVNVSVPEHNGRALILTPAFALPPGHYQVVLGAGSGVSIRSIDGTTLGAVSHEVNDRVATRFDVIPQARGQQAFRDLETGGAISDSPPGKE